MKQPRQMISALLVIALIAGSIPGALISAQEVPPSYTIQHLYDNQGAVVKTVYPNGTEVGYEYNAMGKVKKVTKNGVAVVTSISYAPTKLIQEIEYANGIRSTFTYDANELHRLRNKKILSTPTGEMLQDITYTYDPVGNITRMVDTGTGIPKDATFTYDDLDRLEQALIQANGQRIEETYTYSPGGNILTKADNAGSYGYEYANPTHPHAVTKAGDVLFEYDVVGNLIKKIDSIEGTATYGYDYQSRLTTLTTLQGTSAYLYGEDYNRVQKRLADGSSLTYIGELSEIDQDNNITNYIFVPSGTSDLRVATLDPTGLYYNITDHLASSNLQLNESGAIVQKLDYLPFGTERLNEKSSAFQTHFTFTDQEKDSESNLLYYGARYYNPLIARFLQPDPILLLLGNKQAFEDRAQRTLQSHLSNPQNLNPYSYVINNPLKYTDQEGEILFIPILLAAWAVAELGLSAYDVYDAAKTVLDSNASLGDKGISVLGAGLSVVAPGGGYGTAGKQIAKQGDKAIQIVQSAKKFDAVKQRADWLKDVQNPTLRNIIEASFQHTDTIPGGTAGAIHYTKQTKQLVGNSNHIIKGQELLTRLNKAVKNQKLSQTELKKANELRKQLMKALRNNQ